MVLDKATIATICSGYSIIGALFMLWVGLMLTYQPFFIQGLDDVTGVEGKKTAFQTMFLFLATLLTSIGYLVYDKERIRREAAYEAVDNFDFTLPRGMTDYVVREIELT